MDLRRLLRFGRGPKAGSPAPGRGSRESWTLEVQIHPSDIRRRVIYLFLSRLQVTLWSIMALLYIAFLVVGAAVAPRVLGGMVSGEERQALLAERARQGQRLQELLDEMNRLGEGVGEMNLRMQKVYFAYGLPLPRGAGQGAYPMPVVPALDSVYAGPIERAERQRYQISRRLTALDTWLAEARKFEEAHPEQVRTTPALSPLRGNDVVLISGFGRRRNPFTNEAEFHAGLDLAAPVGTPVHATADGLVLFAGELSRDRNAVWWRYGNLVMVRNGNEFVTVFGHCDQVKVRVGQRIRKGDVVATVGDTGWSRSPHLHYEVRRLGEDGRHVPVEPMIYILDQRWPQDERVVAQARSGSRPERFEPLPALPGIKR